MWSYPTKQATFSVTVVNQKPHVGLSLCTASPNVDLTIPPPLHRCWTKCGAHANTGAGRKEKEGVDEKKEKPTEDSEVERMECERRRKKMSTESIKA